MKTLAILLFMTIVWAATSAALFYFVPWNVI
jgi:hypothetical protein